MALDSLKISNVHTFLIEEIRRKFTEMGKTNCKIQFSWVKAHVGIQGKEVADTLAKEAATFFATYIHEYMHTYIHSYMHT